ncbi:TPA: hypothetical protein DCR49_11505 [Candidatus Delongbacteria bacterium]|nr:MAG: hypothetical protein A2Y39_01430 [Candidatus Delongbacteria bacterium GWF2_40_14]HAQ62599.1 hypothetical protein [Candidatus Delongbacteria bacterium]
MKTIEEQIELVCNQAELESQLAKLYGLYDHKFPMTKIWPMLVEEEKKHESWLMQIIPKIEDGTIYFYSDEVTTQNINVMIESIKKEIDRALLQVIDLKRAVSIALSFEDAALEKNIFSFFDSEDPVVEQTLDKLIEDTRIHRKMLLEAVESLKKQKRI